MFRSESKRQEGLSCNLRLMRARWWDALCHLHNTIGAMTGMSGSCASLLTTSMCCVACTG